jgi:superfamily II DNA or RNA helicase
MISLPSLYPHQEDLRDRTRTALAKHGRVILCAQTGMGKTRTAKWILGASANREP